jgi:hypothetical protein
MGVYKLSMLIINYGHVELVSTPHLLSKPAKQIAYLSCGVLKQVTHDIIKIRVMLNLFQHPTR